MIWLIILLAFVLRLTNLNQSLWFDEAINVVYASTSDFWWYITKYSTGDFHPPGWFAILWVWGHIFGFSEFAVRLPSVILGVATVWLTFLLGKELFSKKVGLLAAILLTVAPLHVYYSQEARMYAFSAFAVTLSFYFLQRLVDHRKLALIGYIFSLVLILYSDYLAYLVIPAQIVYLIWTKAFSGKILVSFVVAGVSFLPWLTIFPLQLQTGINKSISLPGWKEVVGGSNFKDLLLIPIKTIFGKVVLLNKYIYLGGSVLIGAIFGYIFLLGIKKLDQPAKFLVCWIFIPVLLAFLISFFIPVLSYFRVLFILPAFYLVLGKSLDALSKKFTIAGLVFICLVSFIALMGYYLDPKFQREDWKGAVNLVSQKLDKNSLVIFENDEIPAPVRYYNPDLANFKPGISSDLVDNLVSKNKVYLFEYLVDVYDPNRLVVTRLRNLNFIETAAYDFNGVGFIREYTKL